LSSTASVKRRFALLTVGKVLAAGFQAVSFALLAAQTSVSSFGLFFVGVSLTLVVMTPFEFGFGSLSLRVRREEESDRVVSTILAIRMSTNILVAILTGLGWALFAEKGAVIFLASFIAYALAEATSNLAQNLLIGLGRENSAIVVLLARRTLLIAGLLVAILLDGVDVFAVLLVWSIASLAIALSPLGSEVGRLLPAPVRFLLNRRRYWFVSVADNLRQLDMVLVGAIGGATLAGLFAASTRLVAPLGILTSSIMQTLIPELIKRGGGDRDNHAYVSRALRGVTLLGVVVMLAGALAPWLITTIYGSDYSAAGPIAAAIFLVAALNGMNQVMLSWEFSRGLTGFIPIATAFLTCVYLATTALTAYVGSTWSLAGGIAVSAIIGHLVYRVRFHRLRQFTYDSLEG